MKCSFRTHRSSIATRREALAVSLLAFGVLAAPAPAQLIPDYKDAEGIDVVEHVDAPLRLDLRFTNERGVAVKLGSCLPGDKPVILTDYINGGFYFFRPEILGADYLGSDAPDLTLETTVLERLAREGQLMARLHRGQWQPLDHERDRSRLESIATNLATGAAR